MRRTVIITDRKDGAKQMIISWSGIDHLVIISLIPSLRMLLKIMMRFGGAMIRRVKGGDLLLRGKAFSDGYRIIFMAQRIFLNMR